MHGLQPKRLATVSQPLEFRKPRDASKTDDTQPDASTECMMIDTLLLEAI